MSTFVTGSLFAVLNTGETIFLGKASLSDDGVVSGDPQFTEGDFEKVAPVAALSHYKFAVHRSNDRDLNFTLPAQAHDGLMHTAMTSVHGSVQQAVMDILKCNFPVEFIAQEWIDDVAIPTGERIQINAFSALPSLTYSQAKEVFSLSSSHFSRSAEMESFVKNLPDFKAAIKNHDGPFELSIDESDLIRLICLMTDSFGGYDSLADLEERDWEEFTTKCFAIQMEKRRMESQVGASKPGQEKPKNMEHWISLYAPKKNSAREEYDGMLFETFGADLRKVEEVARTEPGRIWTLIEGDDGGQYISSGFRRVNRMGYFICDKAYSGESCEFPDGDDDQEQAPAYLKGTVLTTKDGRRILTEVARCASSDELVFSGRFDSLNGASKHLFLVESRDSDVDPYGSAWEEVAYVELTDAQARTFTQDPYYGCEFQNSPLEKMMLMWVNAEVCPDTDEFDYVEYNAIDDILGLSWENFQKLVSDGRETELIGDGQLPSAFTGRRTVRYDRLILADLIDAFNGKEAFVGRDPEVRLPGVTKEMFESFVEKGLRIRACHNLSDSLKEQVELHRDQALKMRA